MVNHPPFFNKNNSSPVNPFKCCFAARYTDLKGCKQLSIINEGPEAVKRNGITVLKRQSKISKVVPIHKQKEGTNEFPIQKRMIFCKAKEIKGLRGDVL
jgi:hypothetical protein